MIQHESMESPCSTLNWVAKKFSHVHSVLPKLDVQCRVGTELQKARDEHEGMESPCFTLNQVAKKFSQVHSVLTKSNVQYRVGTDLSCPFPQQEGVPHGNVLTAAFDLTVDDTKAACYWISTVNFVWVIFSYTVHFLVWMSTSGTYI